MQFLGGELCLYNSVEFIDSTGCVAGGIHPAWALQCDDGVWTAGTALDVVTYIAEENLCDPAGTVTLNRSGGATGSNCTFPATITVDTTGTFIPCTGFICPCECCLSGFWTQYTFTVAGITDPGGCAACTTLNGTWVLIFQEDSCRWTTRDASFCAGTGPFWTLSCSGGTWSLVSHTDGSLYTTTDDLCITGGTLDLTSPGSTCDTYPATITVSPIGSFIPCTPPA
jgi:hypothetical protein